MSSEKNVFWERNIYLHKQLICAVSHFNLEVEDFSLLKWFASYEKTNRYLSKITDKPQAWIQKGKWAAAIWADNTVQSKITAGTFFLRKTLKERGKHSAILYTQFSLQSESEARCILWCQDEVNELQPLHGISSILGLIVF